jgi:hypothetical protein
VAEPMDLADQFMSCTRKQRFATAELAKQHIVRIWLAGRGDGLKTYRCRVPDQETHWHVGHLVTWWRRHIAEESEREE